MTWEELWKIEYGRPLSDLRLKPLRTAGRCCFKIAEHQYVFSSYDPDGQPAQFLGFAWVASDGAADRVFTKDFHADDLAAPVPPQELLPAPGIKSYREIVEYGRLKHSKTFRTYVIGPCWVIFDVYSYAFRKTRPEGTDFPFVIEVSFDPHRHAVGGHT